MTEHILKENLEKIIDNKTRILLVDDSANVRNSLRAAIEYLSGYLVHDEDDPIHAIPYLKQHPDHYKLIITDFQMVHKNGIEFAQEAYKINSEIPVVVMSGASGIIQSKYPQLPENVKEVFQKPFGMNEMKKMISYIQK